MSPDCAPPETVLEVTTWFVRGRNALLARADFGPLYVDYYLHQADHGMRTPETPDQLLKDLLAAQVLHAAGRPWNQTLAWTLHLQQPLLNLFATTDNELGQVVGQAFLEDVKDLPENIFYADVAAGHAPTQRSVVPFSGADIFHAVEHFYRQSEQRPARLFRLRDEDFALLSAQPDCDTDWLETLRTQDLAELASRESLSLLEKRHYRWNCGCSQDRMCAILAPAMRADAEALFGGEASVRITCPRCGARHAITRETLEAHLAAHPE
jgi:molecular chaperone Hsp33